MNNRNFVIPMRPSRLPPAVEFYIFFFLFLLFYFFHSYMMITIKCRYHTRRIVNFLSANSQTGIIRSTSGLREGRISLFPSLEEKKMFFFSFRVFSSSLVLQFNISSRNSAQKAGGRLHDLAHNSRIRREEKKKGFRPGG